MLSGGFCVLKKASEKHLLEGLGMSLPAMFDLTSLIAAYFWLQILFVALVICGDLGKSLLKYASNPRSLQNLLHDFQNHKPLAIYLVLNRSLWPLHPHQNTRNELLHAICIRYVPLRCSAAPLAAPIFP